MESLALQMEGALTQEKVCQRRVTHASASRVMRLPHERMVVRSALRMIVLTRHVVLEALARTCRSRVEIQALTRVSVTLDLILWRMNLDALTASVLSVAQWLNSLSSQRLWTGFLMYA
jgi:hypothetical protein